MRIAVFTGSAAPVERHRDTAAAFARDLAAAGVGVVYGGGKVGLMGVVADAALAAGGEVLGVMPQHLVDREIAHAGLTRLDVVASMHERKARMAELADAFVALPGGAGTLEELFEVFTWGQLGLHAKPVALLDLDGFYDPLLAQLRAMAEQGYLAPENLCALGVVGDARALLDFVAAYEPPRRKWAAPGAAAALLRAALDAEGRAQAQLLEGEPEAAAQRFAEAGARYLASWEAAPPRAYGRLVGALKAQVLAGDARTAAAATRAAIAEPDSPTAAYARGLAALVEGDDAEAAACADAMRGGSEAFDRAAAALGALARRDGAAYGAAIAAIVADFERRPAHLTGVAIADTALVLERLAIARGLRSGVSSRLLPA